MAKAEKVVRTIQQVEEVVLTLTEGEAKALMGLTGRVVADSFGGQFYAIYLALCGAGITADIPRVGTTLTGGIRVEPR